jgi:glyoxylase-like metal-dependent hydrolase (beta-lactamase superfamily II)
MAYVIDGEQILVGDTLFMPELAPRRDFPGGNAPSVRSIQKLLAFPAGVKLYVCHDYLPEGRQAQCQSTVGEQRKSNIHIHDGIDENTFVAMRTRRDRGLGCRRCCCRRSRSMRAGNMPPAEEWRELPENSDQSDVAFVKTGSILQPPAGSSVNASV